MVVGDKICGRKVKKIGFRVKYFWLHKSFIQYAILNKTWTQWSYPGGREGSVCPQFGMSFLRTTIATKAFHALVSKFTHTRIPVFLMCETLILTFVQIPLFCIGSFLNRDFARFRIFQNNPSTWLCAQKPHFHAVKFSGEMLLISSHNGVFSKQNTKKKVFFTKSHFIKNVQNEFQNSFSPTRHSLVVVCGYHLYRAKFVFLN